MRQYFLVALLTLATAVSSCAQRAQTPAEDASAAEAARQQAQALFGPVRPVAAAEVDDPKAVLGRALYWDTRLSLDGKTSCASCHSRADWSSDRRPRSLNAKGELTALHSQPMFMAQDQVALRWYGDRRDGVHQAERSITGSMGLAKAEDMTPLLRQHGYAPLFEAAFGSGPELMSPGQYGRALQAYQRTLRTPAPFDRFLAGDDAALSREQVLGLRRFVSNGCAGCHGGALLGGGSMQKFGVVKDYWLATGSTRNT
jgi:cytochrome c peroxidase